MDDDEVKKQTMQFWKRYCQVKEVRWMKCCRECWRRDAENGRRNTARGSPVPKQALLFEVEACAGNAYTPLLPALP